MKLVSIRSLITAVALFALSAPLFAQPEESMTLAGAGSYTLYYGWGCSGTYSTMSMTLNANGTWSGSSLSGKWFESGGMFTFNFSSSSTTYVGYTGLPNSKVVVGVMTTYSGTTGCFYMMKTSTTATQFLMEKEPALDAAGN